MKIPFRDGIYVRRYISLLFLLSATSCTQDHQSESAVTAPTVSTRCVFLAVGRQGYGDATTRDVALSMEQVARERRNVNFTMLLGDNFYPSGVNSISDPQWNSKFESLYDGAYLSGMPFYAVAGNHDHQGSVEAELDYSRQKMGSGRWRMDAPYYAKDFGELNGKPFVRVVFLDSVSFLGLGTDEGSLLPSQITRDKQIRFLREGFSPDKVQPYWKIVATHYPSRSLTKNRYSEERVMKKMLPVLTEFGVDLYLSSNDRFQQILDVAGEPLHVGVNGGAMKVDEIAALDTPSQLVAPQRGFALISIDANYITVELFNAKGELSYTRTRAPLKHGLQ